MSAPQNELHQRGEEYRVKAKMTLLRRERLGTYLAWILFAAGFYWGSASAFKRSENGHSGPGGLLDTHHSLFVSPSGAGKQQALDKTENKWAWLCSSPNFISGKQKFEFHRISHITK